MTKIAIESELATEKAISRYLAIMVSKLLKVGPDKKVTPEMVLENARQEVTGQ